MTTVELFEWHDRLWETAVWAPVMGGVGVVLAELALFHEAILAEVDAEYEAAAQA